MKKYIIVLASVIFTGLNAQNIHTGYYSNAFILQSGSNPAAFPEANTVVGFPGLSNLNYGLQWPLSLNEVFEKGADDSLRISFPSIVSNMGKQDVLHLDARHQLFHLGFKLGENKNVFTYFGNEVVTDISLRISGDLVDYLSRGNAHYLNRQMNFDDERLEVSVYHSLYVGAAFEVSEKLNLGLRLKALTGIANVCTEKLHLGFYTDLESVPVYETTLQADVLIQTSGMGIISDSLDFKPTSNSGFAFDIGAVYKPVEELEFSFALTDIGSIDWAEENNEYHTTDGQIEYVIKGLTQSSSGAEDLEAQMEEISDSLSTTMELVNSTGAYSTKLQSNLFLGAKYGLNEKHSISLLLHSRERFVGRFNVYSVGYQLQMFESFQLMASYQNFGGINNIGAGFVWSPGPLQLHLILDNTLIEDVFDAKNFSVQMGLSFHFGKKKLEEKVNKSNFD